MRIIPEHNLMEDWPKVCGSETTRLIDMKRKLCSPSGGRSLDLVIGLRLQYAQDDATWVYRIFTYVSHGQGLQNQASGATWLNFSHVPPLHLRPEVRREMLKALPGYKALLRDCENAELDILPAFLKVIDSGNVFEAIVADSFFRLR